MGSNPVSKRPVDLIRERRCCSQSLLQSKHWRVSNSCLWLPWRRAWRGRRSLYSFLCNSFGWYPPCYTGCSRSGLSRETCIGFCVSTMTCVLSFLDRPGFFLLCSHSAAKPQVRRRLQWGKTKIMPKCIHDTSPVLFGSTKWTDPLASALLNHFITFEKSHPSHKNTSWKYHVVKQSALSKNPIRYDIIVCYCP